MIPVGRGNAIEAIAFVLQLQRNFSADEVQSLASLESTLKVDFPKFDLLRAVSMEIPSPGGSAQSEVRTSGILLNRFLATGRAEWSLKAADNQIIVTCSAYTRWAEVSAKAMSWLQAVLRLIAGSDHQITAVIMQVVDRFEQDLTKNDVYKIEAVFEPSSPFLTKHASASGSQWHVFQGWFEASAQQGVRTLHTLNLMSVQVGTKLNQSVDHTMQKQLFGTPIIASELISQTDNSNQVAQAFEELHTANKRILRQTLCSDQLARIGLNQ